MPHDGRFIHPIHEPSSEEIKNVPKLKNGICRNPLMPYPSEKTVILKISAVLN
jgi:hypothetical protein